MSTFAYLFRFSSSENLIPITESKGGRYSTLSEEEIARLPHTYRNAALKLSKLLFQTSDIEVQRRLFESFTGKFTTHVKILRKWKELEARHIYHRYLLEEMESNINVMATQHFYDETFLNFSFSPPNEFPVLNKVLTFYVFNEKFKFDVDEFLEMNKNIKNSLTFPHPHLNQFWEFYLMHSLSPITPELREKHERAVELEENRTHILRNEKERYIKFLIDCGDHEFIVQNIEVEIGKCPYRKSYWRQYLAYLETCDPKAMLNVYSRYCRFFVNDWKMRDAYRTQIKRLNRNGVNVKHFVNDYKLLLMDFPLSASYTLVVHHLIKQLIVTNIISVYEGLKFFQKRLKKIELPKLNKKSKPIRSSFRGFMPHFLEYLAKNANSKLLLKFYSISRWFFDRRKVPLCHRLCICDTRRTIATESSFFVTPKDLEIDGLKNIYVTNALVVISKDPMALSKMMPKIYKFDPRFLEIHDQILTSTEYEFIVGEGNMRRACFDNVIVTGTRGEQLPVDCLIEKLLNVEVIGFEGNPLITADTSEKLGHIQLKSKIERFDLHEIDEHFDFKGFSEFIRRNGNSTSNFILHFRREVTTQHKLMFRRNLRFIMRTWLPQFTLPQLTIY